MNTQEAKRHLFSLPNNIRLLDEFLKLSLSKEQRKDLIMDDEVLTALLLGRNVNGN
jgi:hypothetical protein